ncbi:CinA family protein [Chloroflexota bacterium]
MGNLEQEVGDLLRRRGLTMGVVESATGGLISHRLTNVPGSSDYYQGSITTYSNQVKIKLAGVNADTIKRYGAVSYQVAEEMARGGREALGVDVCLVDTGIAGPGGSTTEKTVGLFYLGLADRKGSYSRQHNFHGDREQNKQSAAEAALGWFREYLISLK